MGEQQICKTIFGSTILHSTKNFALQVKVAACSKQDTMDKFLHSFSSVGKLSSSLQHARMLSDPIVEFIARDMRPVSVVDGIGFQNLMHVAEP